MGEEGREGRAGQGCRLAAAVPMVRIDLLPAKRDDIDRLACRTVAEYGHRSVDGIHTAHALCCGMA